MRKTAGQWLLAFSLVAPGQNPAMPPRDVPPPQTGTGVIKGRVVDAVTGAAIARARVRLQGRLNNAPTMMTDVAGVFAFAQLPAGAFSVSADKAGYASGRYPEGGRTLRTMSPPPMALRDGETVDVTVQLSRGGVIGGRVLDSYGEPVEYVDIRATRLPPSGQLTAGAMRSNASSNDLGEFRLPRLEPGSYVVSATPRQIRLEETSGLQPLPTYYPGVPSLELAQPIVLKRGDSVSGLVLTMGEGVPSVVTGSVIDSNGQRAAGSMSITVRSSVRGNTTSSGTSLRPDGTFRFTLMPGDYDIEARVTRQGQWDDRSGAMGLQRLSLAGGSVSDVILVLREPSTVTGRFVFDGTSPLPSTPSAISVEFSPDPSLNASCVNARTETALNWTFTVRGLAGTCRVRTGIGDRTWTLKAVKLGMVDLTDRPMQIEPGQVVRDLEIVFTDRRTELSLQVADEHGAPTQEYVAIVFAVDPERWTEQGTRYVRTYVPSQMRPLPPVPGLARPGTPPSVVVQQGAPRQMISGMPAAEYYVVAVDDVEAEYVRDPAFLKQLAPHATRISLAEGTPMQVPLRRIPIRLGQR